MGERIDPAGLPQSRLAALHDGIGLGVQRGFWPVIFAGTAPIALVVQPSAPVDTVQDLIELAKAQRMQINQIC